MGDYKLQAGRITFIGGKGKCSKINSVSGHDLSSFERLVHEPAKKRVARGERRGTRMAARGEGRVKAEEGEHGHPDAAAF